MKWLRRLFNPSAYDQGHQDGFMEGFKEGQDWGHDHGACEHTHPLEEAKLFSGANGAKNIRNILGDGPAPRGSG